MIGGYSQDRKGGSDFEEEAAAREAMQKPYAVGLYNSSHLLLSNFRIQSNDFKLSCVSFNLGLINCNVSFLCLVELLFLRHTRKANADNFE